MPSSSSSPTISSIATVCESKAKVAKVAKGKAAKVAKAKVASPVKKTFARANAKGVMKRQVHCGDVHVEFEKDAKKKKFEAPRPKNDAPEGPRHFVLETFVDGHLASRETVSALSEDPWQPALTIEDLFSWPLSVALRLLRRGDAHVIARNVAQNSHLVLSTQYSGLGGPEICFEHLKAGFRAGGLQFGEVIYWSAADIQKHCREILKGHLRPPKHVFGDLVARVYPDTAQALFMLLGDCRQMRGRIPAKARGARGDASGQDSACGAPELALDEGEALDIAASGQGIALEATPPAKVTFDVLGRQFLAKYLEVVECPQASVWEETAYCFTHAQQCPLSAPAMPGQYRWSIVGTTCTDHSSMRVGSGLAGDCVVPLSVWLAEHRRQLEDVVICECLPAFPADAVAGGVVIGRGGSGLASKRATTLDDCHQAVNI